MDYPFFHAFSIVLDVSQFKELLKQLDKTDWWTIAFNLFGIAIAAYSGYFFQKLFKRTEENQIKKENAYRFNEALGYTSILLENLTAHVELILKSIENENISLRCISNIIDRLKNGEEFEPELPRQTIYSIHPLNIVTEENIISKIHTSGKYIEFVQAFYRMRNDMSQSITICDERNFLIKKVFDEEESLKKLGWIYQIHRTIYDRTLKLLIASDAIMDALFFIIKELETVGKDIKSNLNTLNIKDVQVKLFEPNLFHNEIKLKIETMINQNSEYKDRFRHIIN